MLDLASGAVLLNLLLALFDRPGRGAAWLAIVCLVIAAALKWLYWLRIDGEAREYTIEAATGLGHLGKVRALEPPHTQPNFIMREMGYRVARKHTQRLRKLALLFAFAAPIAMLLLSQMPGLAILGALLAALDGRRPPHRALAVLRRSRARGHATTAPMRRDQLSLSPYFTGRGLG